MNKFEMKRRHCDLLEAMYISVKRRFIDDLRYDIGFLDDSKEIDWNVFWNQDPQVLFENVIPMLSSDGIEYYGETCLMLDTIENML